LNGAGSIENSSSNNEDASEQGSRITSRDQ